LLPGFIEAAHFFANLDHDHPAAPFLDVLSEFILSPGLHGFDQRLLFVRKLSHEGTDAGEDGALLVISTHLFVKRDPDGLNVILCGPIGVQIFFMLGDDEAAEPGFKVDNQA
jgi:hypothetical protein